MDPRRQGDMSDGEGELLDQGAGFEEDTDEGAASGHDSNGEDSDDEWESDVPRQRRSGRDVKYQQGYEITNTMCSQCITGTKQKRRWMSTCMRYSPKTNAAR